MNLLESIVALHLWRSVPIMAACCLASFNN